MAKFAVVLFSIGGPDTILDDDIKKYLMNFFSDRFIIRKNFLLRKFVAFLISRGRYKKTQEIYRKIGGKSPILENTQAQADAIKVVLGEDFDTFVSMRYWHPFAEEVMEKIAKVDYETIVLLPMYPQCSSTTTVSAFEDWKIVTKKVYGDEKAKDILSRTKLICKHFDNEKYLNVMTDLIVKNYREGLKAVPDGNFKLFFSAHSIPEYLVTEKGDPYQSQIISTVSKIMEKLHSADCKLEHMITYQSKVGRMKWLEPMTETELVKCAKEKIVPIIIPVAFVSENSETLFELDMDYRELLKENGMPDMFRVPTVSCNELYIECLVDLIKLSVISDTPFPTGRGCSNDETDCPCVRFTNSKLI